MTTFLPKESEITREWFVVDATEKPLGRLAAKIVCVLRGKNKPIFTPHIDTGDFIVIINAEKVKLTGRKDDLKLYSRYSGYRGGLRKTKASVIRERHPDRLIRKAVVGMMPNNTSSRKIVGRLKIYKGAEHPHAAQNPKQLDIMK